VDGRRVNTTASFMDFASPSESVGYLVSKWYQGRNGANQAQSVEQAARILKQQGYATDPDYVNKLLRIVRSNRRP
jgi:flagellum-specific peptidoglycan hydrolase FlgJ